MVGSPFSSALLLLSIISAIRAQLTVQSDWVFPQSPDYSTTVNIGSTVYFRWTTNLKNQFATYLPNGNSSRVDVWVTGETISNGYHKLASDFDMTSREVFSWTVMVPSSELEDEPIWVLRFIALGDDPTHLQYQISSPLFRIVDNTKSTTSSSATSTSSTSSTSTTLAASTTSATTAAASTTTTSVSSTSATTTSVSSTSTTTMTIPSTTPIQGSAVPTANPDSTVEPTGLSTGAKAGIGAGAGVGIACFVGLFFFCLVRRRRLRKVHGHGSVRMNDGTLSPPMEIQSDVSYISKGRA